MLEKIIFSIIIIATFILVVYIIDKLNKVMSKVDKLISGDNFSYNKLNKIETNTNNIINNFDIIAQILDKLTNLTLKIDETIVNNIDTNNHNFAEVNTRLDAATSGIVEINNHLILNNEDFNNKSDKVFNIIKSQAKALVDNNICYSNGFDKINDKLDIISKNIENKAKISSKTKKQSKVNNITIDNLNDTK